MFNILFTIVPIMVMLIFIFTFVLIFSPKLRGKFMSNQIKATKYMVDESKEDIKDITSNMAEATKDGIKTTTRAIREGLSQDIIYCKHCGSEIDIDSKFCKKCGKEQ